MAVIPPSPLERGVGNEILDPSLGLVRVTTRLTLAKEPKTGGRIDNHE